MGFLSEGTQREQSKQRKAEREGERSCGRRQEEEEDERTEKGRGKRGWMLKRSEFGEGGAEVVIEVVVGGAGAGVGGGGVGVGVDFGDDRNQ
jgi:hypothetical protein